MFNRRFPMGGGMFPMGGGRFPMGGNRFFGGGFLGPFILGGITGGLLAPGFGPRPFYPAPYPYPPPYFY